jgi:hypothetical protein
MINLSSDLTAQLLRRGTAAAVTVAAMALINDARQGTKDSFQPGRQNIEMRSYLNSMNAKQGWYNTGNPRVDQFMNKIANKQSDVQTWITLKQYDLHTTARSLTFGNVGLLAVAGVGAFFAGGDFLLKQIPKALGLMNSGGTGSKALGLMGKGLLGLPQLALKAVGYGLKGVSLVATKAPIPAALALGLGTAVGAKLLSVQDGTLKRDRLNEQLRAPASSQVWNKETGAFETVGTGASGYYGNAEQGSMLDGAPFDISKPLIF